MIYQQEFDMPSVGMHILCIVPSTVGVSVNGLLNAVTKISFNFTADSGSIQPFLDHMHFKYGTSNKRVSQKWKAFTTNGSPIFSIDSLLYHQTFIIHTNGHWLWPGVRIGFTQSTFDGYELTTLSVRPLVIKVYKFLTFEECDLIQSLAVPHMTASVTSKMDKDIDKPDTTWRTSSQVCKSSIYF